GDMERLRRHLRVERWLLLGGSWGATLALAYAQRHPERVTALVLRAVFAATARERRWLYGASGAALLDPAAWRRFCTKVCTKGKQPLPSLAKQLRVGHGTRQEQAARAWLRWEQDLDHAEAPHEGALTNREMAMARIGLHYARHRFWLDGDRLLRRADRLAGIP